MGNFREDLYHRLSVIIIPVPPLRERREDIPLLVRFFLDHMGAGETVCTEEAMHALMAYSWPGNIRELRNAVGHALSLCREGRVSPADLPPELRRHTLCLDENADAKGRLRAIARSSEAQTLLLTLREQGWNVAKTARFLGLSRAGIYVKMRRFGIRRGQSGM